jgi:23S rRNA pseudouridine1911/1915/1917 synthase
MKNAEALVEDPGHEGLRLDVFLSEGLGLFSRSQVKTRVLSVRVNGAEARLSRRLRRGDRVSVDFTDPPPLRAEPEDIPLAIIFENADVIVLDKPQGMVVHPGSGNHRGTLVNALLHHCAGIGDVFGEAEARPGIVHRLDKETSGVIIAAKNPRAHELLSAQFKARQTRKQYIAVCAGRPREAAGRIETLIVRDPRQRKLFTCSETRGRQAVTRYRVLRSWEAGEAVKPPAAAPGRVSSAKLPAGRRLPRSYSLVSLRPRTGRTHQLRVHMRMLGIPILGDPLYGAPDPLFPQATLMLHAHRLTILLPGEEEPRTFTAAVPQRMRDLLESLQGFSARKGL